MTINTEILEAEVPALLVTAAERFILPRFRSLDPADIAEKSHPRDLVTVADREAEEWLTPRLGGLVEGAEVVGEEAVAEDRGLLSKLQTDAPIFTVDPVDGTANFVEGSPRFGVMTALSVAGEVLFAAIYLPVAGDMFTARRGAGAFLNGQPIESRKGAAFAEAMGDYSSAYVTDEELKKRLEGAVNRSGGSRAGHCSAYAYTDLARGTLDYVLQHTMTPWDHAAGTLIVAEAGGTSRFMDDMRAYTVAARQNRPMLSVADANLWETYRGQLK